MFQPRSEARRSAIRLSPGLVFFFLLPRILLASDPPDSEVNPQSGHIETVDSFWSGSDWNIRHTIALGQGQSSVVTHLTSDDLDDLAPRLAIGPAGDAWVVWWRDVSPSQVLVRKRTYATGAWDPERLVSGGGEAASSPAIVHDGTVPWVVYPSRAGGGTGIIVKSILDGPGPIETAAPVATTGYGGDVEVEIHFESAHLWVTWVDNGTSVGWCQYDYATGTWGLPSYESYAPDDVPAARGRIRVTVLGG